MSERGLASSAQVDERDTEQEGSGETPDTGLAALAMIASFHQVACEVGQVRHELGIGNKPASARDIVRAAARIQLKARLLNDQRADRLARVPLPAILQLQGGRFVILGRRLEDGTYRIVDAASRSADHVSPADLAELWTGTLILLTRRTELKTLSSSFGLSWFLPSVWRYRRPLLRVIVASVFVQLCALITPLFFQIIIDKVLAHKGYSTLVLVGVGLVVLGAFHVILQYLRSYILAHTTSRIDVELGARLFDHMLRLPLAYFESRAAGQTVARVRELEQIRNFFTGQGLTAAIDVPFTLLFLVLLYLYSVTLAVVVTLSIPLYIAVAILFRPAMRARTLERFNRSAISNQFLVESVIGIQTIKAMAAEPVIRTQWEDRLAAYVRTAFQAVNLANMGQNIIQYINKITTALVLSIGAYAVINGDLTVGALVAFNMITGQVTAPILRLSQLWQDFQQTKVSIERLGDILNAPPEMRSLASAQMPPAKGQVTLKNVTFRYQPDLPEVLRNVSIDVPVGQVVGIVGPSGSGKSTLTKLVQRLYLPERGQVMIDGMDLSQVDPTWLRRQIGVVLQENLLFNRTIADNIALASPGMLRGQIIAAARLAGAEEFINKMPLGFDTIIEERGANLSGGQRQRIAIARALATNPRILILDEATSALDYESERVIQDNMKQIVRGRTVIIIAHRLAAVRGCDRIIALQDGEVIEDGSHGELLKHPSSLYGRLWRLQSDFGESQGEAA